jgi:hypothetical protein
MKTLRADYDVYVVTVRGRKTFSLKTRPEPYIWRRTDRA